MVNPSNIIAPAQWIKKNMMGVYSEELGRPLTEAEIRVQRCLEQLQVPDWYIKYSKPAKILKSDVPIERRPSIWKTSSKTGSPKKKPGSPKKKRGSPKTPRKSEQSHCARTLPVTEVKAKTPVRKITEITITPTDRSLNSTYRIVRKATNQTSKPTISISSTSSDSEPDSLDLTKTVSVTPSPPSSEFGSRNDAETISVVSSGDDGDSVEIQEEAEEDEPREMDERQSRKSLNSSNTFPRMTPSRKIQNINIVFPEDFTPKPPKQPAEFSAPRYSLPLDVSAKSSTPRTVYTLTKNFKLQSDNDSTYHEDSGSSMEVNNSHTSFLYAEIQPSGVKNTVHVFAGVDSDPEEEQQQQELDQQEQERMYAPSPNTRFFNSQKKSSELERIVQSKQSVQRGHFIRDIINELDRSLCKTSSTQNDESVLTGESGSFVRSMVQALEDHSYKFEGDNDEAGDSDSELAKSTSLSFVEDDRALSQLGSEEEEEEEEVYWIPSKVYELPRTSSRLSVLSRHSSTTGFQCGSGRCSPGLSPIKNAENKHWTMTFSSCNSKASRRLFRIDETNVADSGYGGRSASSRTPTPSSGERSSPSPSSSAACSPTLRDEFPHLGITSEMLFKLPGPVSTKSVFV